MNSNHCIFFTIDILSININFRTIECSFTNILREFHSKFIKNISDMTFSLFPNFFVTNVFLSVIRIPFRQMICYIFFHTKSLKTIFCKSKTTLELIYHLVWSYN